MPRPARIVRNVLLVAAVIGAWLTSMLFGAAKPSGDFSVKTVAQQRLAPSGPSAALITLFTPEAPAGKKFPVLVYFADWDGTKINNRRLLQDLASHGFVIVAVTYPDLGPGMDFSSQTAFETTLRNANERVTQRAQDASQVLDWLKLSSLAAMADMSRVGILGYSFGGAVAAEAALKDPRYKAALNIDGWRFGQAAQNPVPCPYMVINDATPDPTDADLNSDEPVRRFTSILNRADIRRTEADLTRPDVYSLTVGGSDHAGFAEHESWLQSMIPRRGNKGTPPQNLDILQAYALAFFSKYLLGSNTQLLQGYSKEFPNVEVRLSQMPGRHEAIQNGD